MSYMGKGKARFRGRSYSGLSGIGVPSYKNSGQQSAVSKSRESEFPPTEELNDPEGTTLAGVVALRLMYEIESVH